MRLSCRLIDLPCPQPRLLHLALPATSPESPGTAQPAPCRALSLCPSAHPKDAEALVAQVGLKADACQLPNGLATDACYTLQLGFDSVPGHR